jgi:hypothetical protein
VDIETIATVEREVQRPNTRADCLERGARWRKCRRRQHNLVAPVAERERE